MKENPLLDPHARLVIGHRGNRARLPENTVEGLQDAIEAGADAVEFDVRVTRDGVPVLMHDPVLDRTTSAAGRLNELTLKELKQVWVRPVDAGASKLRVPTLEEAMEAVPRSPLVIEIKEAGAVEPVERAVRRAGASGRVVLGSSDSAASERIYRSGLDACASMRDAVVLIPPAMLGLKPSGARYQVLSVTPWFHGVPIPVIRMAVAARKVGVPTQVWTVNDVATAQRYWDSGVGGIVTDDPAAMKRELRQ